MRFKGSIVIGDPGYFVKEEDWEKCEYGDHMDKIGFSDFMIIRFPEDLQTVLEEGTEQVFGGICQDSGFITVVYLDELKSYNPDYEKGFYSTANRAIIQDFDGKITTEIEEIDIDGEKDTCIIVKGTGNINFRSANTEALRKNKRRKV